MFENRVKPNGSAYLAEPYSPTSVQDSCRHNVSGRYATTGFTTGFRSPERALYARLVLSLIKIIFLQHKNSN